MSKVISLSELTNFTPKQQEAIDAAWNYRFVLYGGARGGGKSYLLRWWLVDFLLHYAVERDLRGMRVALFCETYPDLRDRQISKIKTEFPDWLGTIKETKEDGLGFFMNEDFGGGVIALRNLDDPAKYQSAEFAAEGVDELTKNQKDVFDILRGSLRWPGVETRFMGATNPGSIGHMWVRQYWLDRIFPPEMNTIKDEFKFIQSLPTDNPHLDEQYWDDLKTLPHDLQRAWVYGDWDVFAGQAFGTYRADKHIIAPFEIPTMWPKWRAVDWGYRQPFCCLWLTLDPNTKHVYVYREVYAESMSDTVQAQTIKQNTPEANINITYADPSMWAKKVAGNVVTTTASEYALQGVILVKGNNDRLDGKRKVDRLLEDLPDGTPRLRFFSTCVNLIRTLPSLAYDDTNVEDVSQKQEDHAYDALRYGLTGIETKSRLESNRHWASLRSDPWRSGLLEKIL